MLSLPRGQLINHLNSSHNLSLRPPPAHYPLTDFLFLSLLPSAPALGAFASGHSTLAVPVAQMLFLLMCTWHPSHSLTSLLKCHHLREVSPGLPIENCTLLSPKPSPLLFPYSHSSTAFHPLHLAYGSLPMRKAAGGGGSHGAMAALARSRCTMNVCP